jgi:hypothetical protein
MVYLLDGSHFELGRDFCAGGVSLRPCLLVPSTIMSDFKIGQQVTVKLSGGRLVDAEIKGHRHDGRQTPTDLVWKSDRPDL